MNLKSNVNAEVRFDVVTPPAPGAVAIVQIYGHGARDVLQALTGRSRWSAGRLQFCRFANIDEGLAVMLRDDWAQLMPHGGPRVVAKLAEWLMGAGAMPVGGDCPARERVPEASCELEALALDTLARSASPAAIDLLLGQTALWREVVERAERGRCHEPHRILEWTEVVERSDRWNWLIDPPTVAVVGAPNVGKSTLTNFLTGRSASIVADLPGTTRDWIGAVVELPAGQRRTDDPGGMDHLHSAVAVRWVDTPGIRQSDDPIEQQAIAMASRVIASADVVIAMRDDDNDWLDSSHWPREPDLWCMNKIDRVANCEVGDGSSSGSPIGISAQFGKDVEKLQQSVIARLGLADVNQRALWAFCPALRDACENRSCAGVRALF